MYRVCRNCSFWDKFLLTVALETGTYAMPLLIPCWYRNRSWRLRGSFHVWYFSHHILVGEATYKETNPWKPWNMEPYFHRPWSFLFCFNTKIGSNLLDFMAPCRFPMRSWSGIGASIVITCFIFYEKRASERSNLLHSRGACSRSRPHQQSIRYGNFN